MSEERIIDLETKLAFQDQTIHDLNEVITDQQVQLDRLKEEIRILHLRMTSMAESVVNPDEKEPPPPHY